MAKKKSKESTLEIIIAIILVIFVFSLVGILNLQKTSEEITGSLVGKSVEKEETTTEESTGSGSQLDVSVQEVTAVEVSTPAPFGTHLSSSSSSFMVMPPA